ncbi:MAG: hypothetical protein AB7G75_00420 [Candidatus Binatia bacterium]
MPVKDGSMRRQKKSTERVKAWIYSVMNPLMEDLLAENTLLSKKNITWRYQTMEMEFIQRAREHISPSLRPNYDDLLRGMPILKPQMEERDEKVEMLFQIAQECWQQLVSQLHFQVEQSLLQWEKEGNPYPGGGTPEGGFFQLVAEYVMNNIEELPAHYTSRTFWSRFRADFLVFRSGHNFSRLEQTLAELKQANEALIETLDQTRSELCEEYDIPAAPIN